MVRLVRRPSLEFKAWMIPVAALLLLTLVYGLISSQIAAWVGGKIISRTDLDTRLRIVQFSYDLQYGQSSHYQKDFAERNKRDILDQLTEELILLEEAADLATAEEQLEYATSLISWIKLGFYQNDEGQFVAALDQNRLAEDQLQTYFARNLQLIRLREQVTANTEVSAEEVQTYYSENKPEFNLPEMVKVSHILVESKEKANQLLTEAKSGADFAALAKEHSLDTESASYGGGLRWFQRGEMLSSFEEAAFALEPGQLSTVIQTERGYHIIKSEGKEAARLREFNEVSELVKQKALESKREQNWEEYRRSVRGKRLVLLLSR